jgi:hypothetical protein
MRLSLPLACLALAFLAACSPGANRELRGLVEELVPANRSMLECEWGSSSYVSDPKSYYGCQYFVPGKLERVSRRLASRLVARGFAVSCTSGVQSVKLTGARGDNTVYADILADGFEFGSNVSPSDVDIPRGEVFLDISAQEERAESKPKTRARTSVGACRTATAS